MTDLEYTMLRIHESAQRIVEMTAKPELDIGSWFTQLGNEMLRLQGLFVVQDVPAHLADVSYEEGLATGLSGWLRG